MKKPLNGWVAGIAGALVVASVVAVFGFGNTLDKRLDGHDVRMARTDTEIEHLQVMLEKMDTKLDRLLDGR